MKLAIGDRAIRLHLGDITRTEADAIVNAANSHLAGGGGVDGAIHRAGGPKIMEETRRRYPAGCPTGSAVITGAGELTAKFIIHAVGPVWQGGTSGEESLLSGAYRTSLELAAEQNCRTIALPALSTGVYRYPMDLASRVALATTHEFLSGDVAVEEAVFVLFDEGAYGAFAVALEELGAAD